MIEKVNFIFYGEWIDYFKEMNDKEIAQTMRAIFETVEGREAENLKGVAAVTYKVIKNQIERDVQKYREKCEKNKENIKKRWQKGTNDIPTEYDRNTTVSENDTNVIPNNDFGMVKKSNKEKEKENKNKRESKERKSQFETPSLSQVKKVCEELGFEDSIATGFYNYYEANGWMQGRDKPILNWVAQLSVWASREHEFAKPKNDEREKGKSDYPERKYTREELDQLFDNLDEIEI